MICPKGAFSPQVLACASLVYLVQCTAETAKGPATGRLEEGEWLAGGLGTNTGLLGRMAFAARVDDLDQDQTDAFFTGNGLFNQNWISAPASTESRDGLGPTFNARSCSACHFKDGRGAPPYVESDKPDAGIGLLFRLSVPGTDDHGGPLGDPVYGGQLQPFALPEVKAEGQVDITFEDQPGNYGDGGEFTLKKPIYKVRDLAFGPMDAEVMISPRVAPGMVGLGLLEAIPEAALLAHADADDEDGDGISGRPNRVWDVEAETTRLGRFGWKAEQPSVRQQAAGALLGDMGITSTLFPEQNCPQAQTACRESIHGGDPEINDHRLDAVVLYSRTLAVPVRRDWDDPKVLHGKTIFHELGCASCHVPKYETGEVDITALSHQTIWPYTDLLLHDMGPELADGRPTYEASGSEWRTPPLWGMGRIQDVNDHLMLMHDGRASGFAEAILWHGGEGEAAKEAFRTRPQADRAALLRFLESL